MKRVAALLVATIASMLSVLVTPAAEATEVVTGWSVKYVTLASGRTFYVNSPDCSGGPCTTPRSLVIYTHGVGAPEDLASATQMLTGLRRVTPEVVYAYSVSAGGTKRFDAGINYCCTWRETYEVQYLTQLTFKVHEMVPLQRWGVKLMGSSNGGMLSQRAICIRPDLFVAAASWAGTWRTTYEGCTRGKVNIRQWHDPADPVVPFNGGVVTIFGRQVDVPPASAMGSVLLPGSQFVLTEVPGAGHTLYPSVAGDMARWLAVQTRIV